MYIFVEKKRRYDMILPRGMHMDFILLNANIYGFKCINKPVDIQFTNKNIDNSVFSNPYVKAIYGTNGTGKSTIIQTLNFYTQSILDDDYIRVSNSNLEISRLINQKTQKGRVSIYFTVKGSSKPDIFHHLIEYSMDGKKGYISKEELSYCNGQTWGDANNETTLFEVKQGNIIFLSDELKEDKKYQIVSRSNNLLTNQSLIKLAFYTLFNQDGTIERNALNRFERGVLGVVSLLMRFSFFVDEKDTHRITWNAMARMIETGASKELTFDDFRYGFVVDNEIDEVSVMEFDKYCQLIKKEEKFIKIFKPELKRIEVDKDPKGKDIYVCSKIFVYSDGTKVTSEYESNGIKKLMKLFNCLNNASMGGISFIDEFDSNIHDVYLCKLIEYFVHYTKGQLVFTTHNLGPMQVLGESKIKHSIDFINKSVISSWKKNGNYSVVNVYRSGSIPNCPFNIDSADFIRAFGD